jgi:hypothetical protein
MLAHIRIDICRGEKVMTRHLLVGATLAAALASSAAQASAEEFSAKLVGFNEVPAAILTDATGTLSLKLDRNGQKLTYRLTFSGLSAPVTQSHIHFGKIHVAGSVILFLCGTTTSPGPAGTPICPQSGSVTRTITAADLLAIPAQGVPAGNFDALTDLLVSNTGYANVHSTNFPSGEIRGEIRPGDRDDDDR